MKKESNDGPPGWGLVLAAAVVMLLLWTANLLVLIRVYPTDGQARGTFGDSFGGLNALFSGLAFSLLIYTAILQRKELELQRKELRDTRVEFERQTENARKQTEIQTANLELLREESERRERLLKVENSPKLMVRDVVSRSGVLRFTIVNAGAQIYDLSVERVEQVDDTSRTIVPDTILGREKSAEVVIEFHNQLLAAGSTANVTINFRNGLSEYVSATLTFVVPQPSGPPIMIA